MKPKVKGKPTSSQPDMACSNANFFFFCTKEGASSFVPFKGFAKSSSSSHLDRHGLSGDAQTDRFIHNRL